MSSKYLALTIFLAGLTAAAEANAREGSAEASRTPADQPISREPIAPLDPTAPRVHVVTARDLLADSRGRMSTAYLRAASNSQYFMQHVPPLLMHQVQSMVAVAGETIPYANFEGYLEVVAMAKASRWKVAHGDYTRFRVAATLVVMAEATEVATRLVGGWVCRTDERCSPAKLLGRSTLVREALVDANSDLATYVRESESPLKQIHWIAWTAVAEARFLEALGVRLDEALTPDQVADLIEEATDRGDMPQGMAGVADQLRSDLQLGPAGCSGDTLGLAAGPFGACGLPDLPGGPDGGDPSPIDGAAMGAGPGPSAGMTPIKGGWGLPGACHGLDPSRIFNGNAGAGQEIQGTPNAQKTLDYYVSGPIEIAVRLAFKIPVMGFMVEWMAYGIDNIPAVAFPDPLPPEATPEPDASGSSEQGGEQEDQGPEAPPEGEGDEADGGACAPAVQSCEDAPPRSSGSGRLDPLGDSPSSLADACGSAVANALVGCMFPSQPGADPSGFAMLCNEQAPVDCGFEACDFACACQSPSGDVCSPTPGQDGFAACAEGTSDQDEEACPDECAVLVVASMANPELVAPGEIPPECAGCGVVAGGENANPCLGDTPMPPRALVPLCGAYDPIWAGSEAAGVAEPWATPPAWMADPAVLPLRSR